MKVTAENITDEMIRELQREKQESSFYSIAQGSVIRLTVWALSKPGSCINGQRVTQSDIVSARARIAEILNRRAKESK
jgi:hypothetical protein